MMGLQRESMSAHPHCWTLSLTFYRLMKDFFLKQKLNTFTKIESSSGLIFLRTTTVILFGTGFHMVKAFDKSWYFSSRDKKILLRLCSMRQGRDIQYLICRGRYDTGLFIILATAALLLFQIWLVIFQNTRDPICLFSILAWTASA